MGQREDAEMRGERIETVLPVECAEELAAVIRRGQRMGAASTEIELHARGRTVHLAVTSARLDLAHGKQGTVLVIEDTTELLRASGNWHGRKCAACGSRNQESAYADCAFSGANWQAPRSRPGRFAQRYSQMQRGHSGVRGTLRTLVDQFSAWRSFPHRSRAPAI